MHKDLTFRKYSLIAYTVHSPDFLLNLEKDWWICQEVGGSNYFRDLGTHPVSLLHVPKPRLHSPGKQARAAGY
jgi:hypothetical protein